jgi:hypothetical protein
LRQAASQRIEHELNRIEHEGNR